MSSPIWSEWRSYRQVLDRLGHRSNGHALTRFSLPAGRFFPTSLALQEIIALLQARNILRFYLGANIWILGLNIA